MFSKITGIGSYFPERILSNNDLEKMVETSDEWITERTGIKQRRICSNSEATSDMATNAAKIALEKELREKEVLELRSFVGVVSLLSFENGKLFALVDYTGNSMIPFDWDEDTAYVVFDIEHLQLLDPH